jgi:hypothetical protein
VARGNFVIDAEWREGAVTRIRVHARQGGRLRLACRGLAGARVTDAQERPVLYDAEGEDRIGFETETGGQYLIEELRLEQLVPAPRNLTASQPDMHLAWEGAEDCCYNVYRAVDGAPDYETLATRLTVCEYRDSDLDFSRYEIVTYKVTACRPDGSSESDGPTVTLNHATTLDVERYRHRVRQQNLDGLL